MGTRAPRAHIAGTRIDLPVTSPHRIKETAIVVIKKTRRVSVTSFKLPLVFLFACLP
jgi:hypothetical protein